MLVLSRYQGQSIVVGEDVVITVLNMRGNTVRLGVSAPPHVAVDRLEIRLAKNADRPLGDLPYRDDLDTPGRKES